MLYGDYVSNLSKKISKRFDDISTEYNFDFGPEFEVALCRVLREFLPNKYGICRGFVVSSDGLKEGDDIIIFDQERFPTLRLLQRDNFEIKEQIPIEAVYAYIEAKHSLTSEAFNKSISQIIKVKKICSTRNKLKLYQLDPYIDTNIKPPNLIEHLPEYRNPIFTMIFSRFGIENNKTNKEEVEQFLRNELDKLTKENFEFFPELIVAGNNNFLSTAYSKDGINKPTLFHLSDRGNCGYQVIKAENIVFGIAFAHLFAAIDWIRLGKMPWENIINESKEFDNSVLETPLNENLNAPLEIEFNKSDFVNGLFLVKHRKGYTPQVSVLNEEGEEVFTEIRKNKEEVEIQIISIDGFKGRLIIT